MHEALRLSGELPQLRDPVLLAAFSGWTDEAGSAVATIRHLRREWGADLLAELDPDYFYDFTADRPRVRLEGGERAIRWPQLRIHVARPPGAERDFVLLAGKEPSLRWQTLAEALTDLMRELGGSTSVMLGALGGAVPHTRPSPVMLWGAHGDLEAAFGLESTFSDYQGPVGFQNALAIHHASLGWSSGFLFAMAPHYLTLGPHPNVVKSLVETLDRGFGTSTSTDRLVGWNEEFERRIREAMKQSRDPTRASRYIEQLEAQYDASPPTASGSRSEDDIGASELPSSDEVIRGLEQFLREQRTDQG